MRGTAPILIDERQIVPLLREQLGEDLRDAVVVTTGRQAYRRSGGIAVDGLAVGSDRAGDRVRHSEHRFFVRLGEVHTEVRRQQLFAACGGDHDVQQFEISDTTG